MKTIIASPHAPKAVGPYSQAVEAAARSMFRDSSPIDAASGKMDEGIEAQTRRSLTNLGHILREAGYDYSDVVKTTVLLQSIGDFAAMNAVYAEFFTSEMPARMCYQGRGAADGRAGRNRRRGGEIIPPSDRRRAPGIWGVPFALL